MLYETLSQPIIFLWLLLGGLATGFLFDIKNILANKIKKQQIIKEILTFFTAILTFFAFYYLNLKFNYGQFRLWTVAVFALSICLQRFLMNKYVALPLTKCYNKIKGKCNVRRKRKHKES